MKIKTYKGTLAKVNAALGRGTVVKHAATDGNRLGQSGNHTFADDILNVLAAAEEGREYRALKGFLDSMGEFLQAHTQDFCPKCLRVGDGCRCATFAGLAKGRGRVAGVEPIHTVTHQVATEAEIQEKLSRTEEDIAFVQNEEYLQKSEYEKACKRLEEMSDEDLLHCWEHIDKTDWPPEHTNYGMTKTEWSELVYSELSTKRGLSAIRRNDGWEKACDEITEAYGHLD